MEGETDAKKTGILFAVFSVLLWCCVLCILPLFFFLIIGLPASLKTVGYDKWGLNYNKMTQTISDHTYSPGMYWLGNAYFITLPKTYISIDFNANSKQGGGLLDSRTKDGLSITLEISFQYKIERENVQWVFSQFATEYEEIIIYISRDIVRDVCSNFNAFQFFTDRQAIGNELEKEIRTELKEIRITLGYFQLRAVDLPNDYEAIIEESEIQRQRTIKASLDQESALVVAETEVLVSKEKAGIQVIEAMATAKGYEYEAMANANKTITELAAYKVAYNALQDQIGLSNEEILSYVFLETIETHSSSKMTMGIDVPDDVKF